MQTQMLPITRFVDDAQLTMLNKYDHDSRGSLCAVGLAAHYIVMYSTFKYILLSQTNGPSVLKCWLMDIWGMGKDRKSLLLPFRIQLDRPSQILIDFAEFVQRYLTRHLPGSCNIYGPMGGCTALFQALQPNQGFLMFARVYFTLA
jgi:hypothetical protein